MKTQRHWLLLRGLGRDTRHWGDFVRLFQQHFPADKVTTLDTCGNGIFADSPSPLRISGYTEHCRQQLADLEGQKGSPIHLVALSLGGMVAMDWAMRHPTEVQSVTLINTSAANLTAMTKRINFKTLAKLVWTIAIKRQSNGIEQAILEATSNRPISEDTLAQWADFRRQNGTSVVNLLRQLLAAARFKLAKLPLASILVLASKNDRLVHWQASQSIAEYLDCPIKYHPDAGHDLPLDDGHWILEQLHESKMS